MSEFQTVFIDKTTHTEVKVTIRYTEDESKLQVQARMLQALKSATEELRKRIPPT